MAYPPTAGFASIVPTVLQRICTELKARFVAMKDEDNDNLWNQVLRGPIPAVPSLVYPVVSLEHGSERTILDMWPHKEKIVSFFVEFRFERRQDVDSYETFRYYLGKLEQRLFGAKYNIQPDSGLWCNVIQTDANPQIESQDDIAPGGLVAFQVHYRHWNGDPYHLPSETPSYAYGTPI